VNKTTKKILLLGGTGAMGVYLAPMLADLNYDVYITSRKEQTSENIHIHYIQGNAKDIHFLEKLLTIKYDAIVDFMIYRTNEFADRYEKLLNSTAHYLFLSSYRVYGNSNGEPIKENSPRLLDCVKDETYLATDEYALTKARQENILISSNYKNWTIIRPAITYSHTRFQLGTMEANEFLSRTLKNKTVIFPKQMLEKETTMSWAGDVANMISKLILNENAMCEIFTAATAEHHKWKEVIEYYQKIVNLKVKIVDLQDYQNTIGRLWQIKYDRMYDRIVDNNKILSATGMKQADLMPLEEGLRIELENFIKNPIFAKIDPVLDAKMDEMTSTTPKVAKSKILKPVSKVAKLFSSELTVKEKIKKLLKHLGIK